jgi:hypothetical protein
MPSLSVGYRYWGGDKAKELNLKIDYSGSSTYNDISSPGFAFCLSWNRIIGY